ncbi:lipoprotein-releasing ABC transporter permease subunit [Spongiibacter nanhainus]|uniref:Lipoprotein-releasing ABC transporter permease subunit n=1 Tax=Spongiibacter nanhainus TaxID=2794344 RepID=A0A7T4UP66_9GAMM|nr:lipoprotein-releasing ABC transporter permease subunit [Spongiibacter nanhainus]QQD16718.1 lipoprotein-releasing ABC transporter permease subunit [Spongiibacter nanhainus]
MGGLPLIIARRYATGRSSNQLVSFLSRLSMAGLVLGVALLVVVLSVMNGFDREMRERILSLVPHVTLQPWSGEAEHWTSLADSVSQHPEVVSVAPYVQGNAMLIKRRHVEPIVFFGIAPELEDKVSSMSEFAPIDDLQAGRNTVILGQSLAEKLGLAVGDGLSLGVPQQGQQSVTFARFTLGGLAATGTELDQQLVLMHIDDARSVLPNTATALRVSVGDVFDAPRIAWELLSVHGRDFEISNWSRQFGNMYHAIQMSRRLVAIMLLAVVAVAVFNVVSTLVMVVNDKRADIAILRSQGASRGDILLSFLYYGAIIAALGTLAGGLLGVGLAYYVGDLVAGLESLLGIQFLHSDVYPISYLPSDIRVSDVIMVCATAYLMSVLATLYPAWRASRQAPAEALHQH